MSRASKNFKTVRIGLLVLLALGAVYLLALNRGNDPRFYKFLGSAPGQFLSRVFKWDEQKPVVLEVPEEKMSAEELAVKRRLEQQVNRGRMSDIVRKQNGQEIVGNIVLETSEGLTIVQRFGDSGGMKLSIKREDIVAVERGVESPAAEITYRDVRFQMEFPDMNLYRRPPYTVVTSEKFFDVEDAVRTLEYLHGDFVNMFDPLIRSDERGKSIQLLFFSDEDAYTGYRKEHAPNLGYSAGFYSPQIDRFVIFDQKESLQMQGAEAELERMYKEYQRTYKGQATGASIRAWYDEQRQNLLRLAREENTRVLRHEGAHQLFYTYGVHSEHHAENLWLIEGFAVYCETDPVGRTVKSSRDVLLTARQNSRLIPIEKLVRYRSPQGFGRLVRDGEIDIAYAESWALVHYLMRPERQEYFFNFLDFVRDEDNTSFVAKEDRFALLCQVTGEDPEGLLERVVQHVSDL